MGKLSRRTLLKLKNKNQKLKPNKYKKFKREVLRGTIKGTLERPRLSVYRSIKLPLSTGRTCDASRFIGEKLAERSLKKNITKIVFDRGPYLYHGRIKALADGARAGGLKF